MKKEILLFILYFLVGVENHPDTRIKARGNIRSQFKLWGLLLIAGLPFFLSSCEEEVDRVDLVKADIFFSVVDKQVAFTALTLNVDTWNWDFGDGGTSTDKDPVHVYEEGGTYAVTLVANNNDTTISVTTEISLALSAREMLTGGSSYPNGKTWKLSSAHSTHDAICLANAGLTVVQAIPQGALNLYLGLAEEYDDEFTFKSDGSYIHDTKNGGAFAGLVYTSVTKTEILKITESSKDFGFCIAAYTAQADATFTFTEEKDLTVTTVEPDGKVTANVNYSDVSTLNFSGTEFIGLMDFMRECIVQEITPDKMRLVMFMSGTSGAYYDKPSYAVIFTFEKVE